MTVSFDLDRVLQLVSNQRVAVACTPAGWIPGVGNLGDHLCRHADVRGFLALEHGLRGELQDGVLFDSYVDEATGVPVFSFYGDTHTFPEDFLADIDTVVFQAQDISHRAYTYKQALADTLLAASHTRTRVVVVDRPTPLGHLPAAGPCHPQYFPAHLPVILPVTLGELAGWVRNVNRIDVELDVVAVRGWTRDMAWSRTGLPWVPPSPNIPSLDSVYAYACTGILQHTNISEGRGTCKPFETIGAPFVDGTALATQLNGLGLPGVAFRDVNFQPTFNKYAGEVCAGVHLMIRNPAALDPLRTMFAVLRALAERYEGFEVTDRFASWLDGGEWSAERLRTLDVHDYLSATQPAAESFMAEVVGPLPY